MILTFHPKNWAVMIRYNFGPGSHLYGCLRSVAESHKIEIRAANREAGKTVSARDFNYSPHLDYLENDFIVPGPGAEEGIRKCFVNPKKVSEKDIIDCLPASVLRSRARSRGLRLFSDEACNLSIYRIASARRFLDSNYARASSLVWKSPSKTPLHWI